MIIFRVLFMGFLTVFFGCFLPIWTVFDRKRTLFYFWGKMWWNNIVRGFGIRLNIVGLENITDINNCVFVANHCSFLDIPVMLNACARFQIRILYKEELKKIPFLGWGIAVSPSIAINRTNAREGLQSLEKMLEQIRGGNSVLIFAEGTRSPDGRLAPFKRGAFLMAAKAQKPIVPVSIIGTRAIWDTSALWRIKPGVVTVVFHPPLPVPAEGGGKREEVELMNNVHAAVASGLPPAMQPIPNAQA